MPESQLVSSYQMIVSLCRRTRQPQHQTLSDDAEKKLLVGNWDVIPEYNLPNDSNAKLADPKVVTAETIFSVGERLFQNNKFPNFNEISINYMREPDISLSQSALEKKVEFND